MAELSPRERLQPALLDRLTDDEPEKKVEPRERRVLSLNRLRELVLRDLGWLLNTASLEQTEDLTDFPFVRESVLNFGGRTLSGQMLSSLALPDLERSLRQAIWDFEPRILRDTVKITCEVSQDEMSHNSLTFKIEGVLWAQPVPLHLFLKTEMDLETGDTRVSDETDSRA